MFFEGDLVDPESTLTMSGLDSMDIMTLKQKLEREAAGCVLATLDTAILEGSSWTTVAQLALQGLPTAKRREGRFGFAPAVSQ